MVSSMAGASTTDNMVPKIRQELQGDKPRRINMVPRGRASERARMMDALTGVTMSGTNSLVARVSVTAVCCAIGLLLASGCAADGKDLSAGDTLIAEPGGQTSVRPFDALDRYVSCLRQGEREEFWSRVRRDGFAETLKMIDYPITFFVCGVNSYGYRTPWGLLNDKQYGEFCRVAGKSTRTLRELSGAHPVPAWLREPAPKGD